MPPGIRTFNKYVTNRVLRGLADYSHGPFAVIRHVGRRTGKCYETMIMVWPSREGFVIALTYGKVVDWYRNVIAAGGGTIVWHCKTYAVENPELVDAATALAAFPAFFKLVLGTVAPKMEYLQVKSSSAPPAMTRNK